MNYTIHVNNDPALRPTPTMGIDPTTPFVYPADQAHFGKFDTQLDLVVAITFL